MVGALIFEMKNKEISIENANKFCSDALSLGVLVIKTGRESVKLSPPLLIDKKSIYKTFDIFNLILKKISSNDLL